MEHAGRQTDRQAGRQADRDKQAGRQTDRQTDSFAHCKVSFNGLSPLDVMALTEHSALPISLF